MFSRIASSREPFWTLIEDRGIRSDVLVLNDRGAIYAVGYPRTPLLGHFAALAELVALAGATFAVLLAAVAAGAVLGGRAPASGRALLREVRASFYRTLFLAFVAAVVVPVVALALVTRAYMATILLADIEQGGDADGHRPRAASSRTSAAVEARGGSDLPVLDDSLARVVEPRGRRGHQHVRRPEPAGVERAQPVCVRPAADPHPGRRLSGDRAGRAPSYVDAGARRRPTSTSSPPHPCGSMTVKPS